MYETVDLKDTTDVTLLSVIGHHTNPFLPIFHIIVWWLKEGRAVTLKLLLLIDKTGCFVLSIIVKILRFVDLQN